ncbi:MAG: hypothetical protein MUP70_10825, partial [Candidatus Aminicenantes bacterium]|nr:hypothetical protein [Candidatus Aminicenantes bacterium]
MSIKGLYDRLNGREKLFFGVGAGLFAAALLFLVFIASHPKREYQRAMKQEQAASRRVEALEQELSKKREALNAWDAALADLQTLRNNHLYSQEEALLQIRLDLEKIFQANDIFIPDLEYDYETSPDSGLGFIKLGFIMTTDYNRLKRFIHAVESFPRF